DVVPTLLDYCGVAVPPDVQGQTFRGAAQGDRAGPRDAVFAEAYGPSGYVDPGTIYWYRRRAIEHLPSTSPGAMVRTGEWKLCWRPNGLHELYHLTTDPYEQTNVVERPEHQAVRRELEQRLLAWLLESTDPRS
ncbi:MAG TPA: sulfatase/phosphatase domain-containing protein, partial [Chloroflexota bacterium]|nr:sulfatase/phosphatase domain-containing protein [Chloroflexota bacterium]